ncbi:MAG: ribonuclease E inhibitor RraB [Chlorobi bacterium]|nr:ribonuclease E inhibitor RraB [Chlorobiota bacterium]
MNKDHDNINPNSGEFILEGLKQLGSDIKQTHEFTFWLYFPEKELAKQAREKAERAGFQVDISPPLKNIKDSQWLCLLFCPHIPDKELLDGISDFCYKLADEYRGKYDGWETRLEIPEGILSDDFIKSKGLARIDLDELSDI